MPTETAAESSAGPAPAVLLNCRNGGPPFVLDQAKETAMFYCILCNNLESEIEAWTREKEAAVMAKQEAVTHKLAAEGRLGPVGRLMPTTTAMTVRASREPLVLDGPFAETKEQLLGFY